MKGTLELNGMEFHAYHGCLPEERRDGNRFTVDFRCSYDMAGAIMSDAIEDALNYAEVYDIVAAQMAIPSNLLEHVAGRIVNALAAAYPWLPEFSVSVTKYNPPVEGPAACSRVTLHHTNE